MSSPALTAVRRLVFAVSAIGALALFARVNGLPRPDWPKPVDAATLLQKLGEANFAHVTYWKDKGTPTSDAKWFEEFRFVLAGASLKPAPMCFCVNFPQISLYRDDRLIATIEVAHGRKLRILGSDGFDGDYEIGPDAGKKLLALATQLEPKAAPELHPVPPRPLPPPKMEIRP